MSVTNVPLPSLESSLLQTIQATPTKTSSTASLSSSASSTSDITSASGNPVTAISRDLSTLLKALLSGDTEVAQTVGAKLQIDRKNEQIAANADSNSPASAQEAAQNDPQALLSNISSSLSNGDIMSALHSLIAYLANTGLAKGNLVNTYA